MGLAVRITTTQAEPQGGHGRNTTSDGREQQPRVPVIGLDAGCIPGTKPGCSASALERSGRDLEIAGRELVRRKLRAARGRR